MNLFNTKIKKTLVIISVIILLTVVLVIIFLSPITKYVIEKYDVKYLGREIKLNKIYVNPFTGYVYIDNFKIYETKSDSIFFSSDGVSANFEIHKLFSGNYEISELIIDRPVGIIKQNKKELNFSDLIEKFSPKNVTSKKNKAPVHFNILNIKINNGTFYYFEKTIPVKYFIKNVNLESAGKMWNSDTISVNYSLASGIGLGDAKGTIMMNLKSLDYKFDTRINKFDLSILDQYLKEISNTGNIRANLDANVKAKGNFKNSQNIDASGLIAINDFHFGKSKTEDYVSFKKFTLSVKELSPIRKKYLFDSVSLMESYFKYERYDHLDNIQNMFGKNGEKVKEARAYSEKSNLLFQIADYVKLLAKNFFKSNYQIKRLAIYKANLHYNDYTLNEKFDVAASPLYIFADSIERSDKWLNLTFKTNIKPYGKASINLSINPKDSTDFSIKYHLQQLPVALFNPYLVTYSSFLMDRGTIELKGSWHVNNGIIQSNNHLVMVDPRINSKQRRDNAKWIPLKFIMFFAREPGNIIDYEVPISGNLKNPKFKFKDVIMDILSNLFFKPLTTRYRAEVRNLEIEIEKAFSLNWETRKSVLQPNQKKFVKELTNYLKNNPSKNINITPLPYSEKEKEYIEFFEAKKLHYQFENNLLAKLLTEDDTVAIDRISIKDSVFINYLNKHAGSINLFTVQDKCKKLIGLEKVNTIFEKLAEERKKIFLSYFKTEGVEAQVKFKSSIYKIPYNGFSFYKIDYKEEWPEDLNKAYKKMMDLNNESPRKEFKEERKNNNK